MSGPEPGGNGPRPAPPTDEEAANAYAEGYGEGLREAFREVLQHASRGHTAQELRILVESRLARLREDIEVKRKSLLGPPRRPSWGPLLRPPSPAPSPSTWIGPSAAPAISSMGPDPGTSVLVREERPMRAPEIVLASLARYPRVLWVSIRPPTDARLSPENTQYIRVGSAGPHGGGPERSGDPGEVAGRVREAARASGGVLVYLDAVEFLTSEYGVETTVRFVNFLTGLAAETRSGLVVSADPNALDPRDQSRLQRAFTTVV